MKKVWLVDFPTYQYKEDVKALAANKNLKIVDSKFGASIDPKLVEAKPPKLTKVGEAKTNAKHDKEPLSES